MRFLKSTPRRFVIPCSSSRGTPRLGIFRGSRLASSLLLYVSIPLSITIIALIRGANSFVHWRFDSLRPILQPIQNLDGQTGY